MGAGRVYEVVTVLIVTLDSSMAVERLLASPWLFVALGMRLEMKLSSIQKMSLRYYWSAEILHVLPSLQPRLDFISS